MKFKDTIYSLVTAPINQNVAIVRISGEKAFDIPPLIAKFKKDDLVGGKVYNKDITIESYTSVVIKIYGKPGNLNCAAVLATLFLWFPESPETGSIPLKTLDTSDGLLKFEFTSNVISHCSKVNSYLW